MAKRTSRENADEWLSTRNKKKLSPPLPKSRGSRRSLSRPTICSPLVSLMDDCPLQLKSTTKQTSIVDFFNQSRLRPLSPQDKTQNAVSCRPESLDLEQKNGTAYDSTNALYSDWEMAVYAPSQQSKTCTAKDEGDGNSSRLCQALLEIVTKSDETFPDCSHSKLSVSGTEREIPASSNTQSQLTCLKGNTEMVPPADSDPDKGLQYPDSLQTPRFLRRTAPFDSLDEPTLTYLPLSLSPNKQRKTSSDSSSKSDSPTDSMEITKEQSSLEISENLEDFVIDSQESLKQAFPAVIKNEKSSLDLNLHQCCSQSSDSSDDQQFDDSLQIPCFGPNSELGDAESANTAAETDNFMRIKRNLSIVESTITKKAFECYNLNTPTFLKKARADLTTVVSVEDRQKQVQSSVSQMQSMRHDLQTPDFLKEMSEIDQDSQLF